MKHIPITFFGLAGLILLAAIAYFWATSLMDSIFAYRSPLKDTPPQAGQALGRPLTRQVVFVLVDALRYDTSLKSDVMPNLAKLRQQGASARMTSRPPSFSEPGYSTLLTGAWPEINDGPAVNLDYDEIPTFTQDNIFSAASRAGLKTAVSGYYWFEKLIPQQAINAFFYTPGEDKTADRQVVAAALPWLTGSQYALVLIHIDQVDYAGHHEGGPQNANWDTAARRADDHIAEILARLDLAKDTILVVSDHGQIDRGGHGGPDPVTMVEPLVLAGAGVKPGQYGAMNMVDVAPTLAALLGANLPASTQGQVRTEMLNLGTNASGLTTAVPAQQTRLLEAYYRAIGESGQIPTGAEVGAYQAALEAARDQRLGRERLPRILLALAVFLIIIYLLWRNRSRRLGWMLFGALVYVAIFNLRYAVLDGRTYSLSSVSGVMDLIVYSTITAGVALAAGWLVTSFGSGVFKQDSNQSVKSTLAFVFCTLFLLSIPVLLHFAWNGATVSWMLPEMWSAFIALISLIQIMLVSILGLLLAGLSGLISRLSHR